jgi:hypothetical protein
MKSLNAHCTKRKKRLVEFFGRDYEDNNTIYDIILNTSLPWFLYETHNRQLSIPVIIYDWLLTNGDEFFFGLNEDDKPCVRFTNYLFMDQFRRYWNV